MANDGVPRPPEARGTTAEIGYAVVKGGFAAIPFVGGLAAELLGVTAGAAYQRRMAEWFNAVADAIADLQSTGQVPTFEVLAEDPRFIDVLVAATKAAQNTGHREKLLALRNAVASSAHGVKLGQDEERRFVEIIDRCIPAHLRLLLYLNDPPRALRVLGRTWEAARIRVLEDVENQLRQQYGGSSDIPLRIWNPATRDGLVRELSDAFGEHELFFRLRRDLLDWHLLHEGGEYRSFSESYLSRLGQAFLQYVDLRPDTAEAYAAFNDANW